MDKKKYTLVGKDGNAFNIMAYVVSAMRKCNATLEQIKDYQKEAMGGDYYHLLAVSQDQIDWCNEQ